MAYAIYRLLPRRNSKGFSGVAGKIIEAIEDKTKTEEDIHTIIHEWTEQPLREFDEFLTKQMEDYLLTEDGKKFEGRIDELTEAFKNR